MLGPIEAYGDVLLNKCSNKLKILENPSVGWKEVQWNASTVSLGNTILKEITMKVLSKVILLMLVLSAPIPIFSQITQSDTPTRTQIIAAAKEIMQTAGYCTLITIGPDGQPQARVVDPFAPDSDLTIFFATNPLTRKVQDIRHDPRVTLLYFSAATHEYVTVIGKAVIDSDSLHKVGHWKEAWASIYKNQNRGEDYMLLRVTPSRLEVVSYQRGMRNDPKTGRPVILDLVK